MKEKLIEMLKEKHRFHPLASGTKKPMFSGWQNFNPDQKTLITWLDQGHDIGWIQDETAALDFDCFELARQFWRDIGPFNCAIQETLRGVHLIFRACPGVRNVVRVNDLYDIRGGGNGYLKIHGFVDGYETTDPQKLDVFREEWLPKAPQVGSKKIKNVKLYIEKIFSVQGQNGSAALVRALSKLRDAEISQAEAMVTILEWNKTNASPEWSVKELIRATNRVYEVYHG